MEGEAKKKEKQVNPKDARKAERLLAKQMAASSVTEETDPLAGNYGDVELRALQSAGQSGRVWTRVRRLDGELKDRTVLIRGQAQAIRGKGKQCFVVVREAGYTVQCIASVTEGVVSKQMVKYISSLSRESLVDVEGAVQIPPKAVSGTSQHGVEILIRKLFCVSRAASVLPLSLEDAARSDLDFENAEKEGKQYARVGQDTRLDNRVLDLRTPANQAIFRVQAKVSALFREYLIETEDFVEIHTPKLLAGASEGGSSVFSLQYMGQPSCLAQSPQLHKQMALCGNFGRVFEIGPVFRAENSFTHRHLCEFIGLDLEMEIKEHYFEVLDVVEGLFVYMFEKLEEKCKDELDTINQQYPFVPLKYSKLRLTFQEGIKMLAEAEVEADPLGDLSTEVERKLGQLVKEKFDTDFYILHRYPSTVRPFYTMPAANDEKYSNSFDVFIRGEEIISGAQRVHDAELLRKRVVEKGIDAKPLSTYIDSFRYGAPPHGGIGVGLERVVMLFCALGNIRKTSMFPRDPRRLAP